MPVEASVSGHDKFNKLAAALDAAARDYDRELNAGLQRAGEVIAKEIRTSTRPYIPADYEDTFEKSLVTTVMLRIRSGARRAIISVKAFGRRGNPRQVEQIERGRLKHKFWGRWVNSPKAWQNIRPGFVTEPAQRAAPAATREMDKACKKISDKIRKG